jgi:hypothetical protein
MSELNDQLMKLHAFIYKIWQKEWQHGRADILDMSNNNSDFNINYISQQIRVLETESTNATNNYFALRKRFEKVNALRVNLRPSLRVRPKKLLVKKKLRKR